MSSADCDDACQTVWIIIARKHEGVEDHHIRSYIAGVAFRIAADVRKRYRRHRFLALATVPGTGATVFDLQPLVSSHRHQRSISKGEVISKSPRGSRGTPIHARRVLYIRHHREITTVEIERVQL